MKGFNRKTLIGLITIGLLLFAVSPMVLSHCEIPCGIYDDQARLDMTAEHIVTIEKSMNQINELSAQKQINYNQLVRWIMNKETHSDYLSDIVTQYFMKQRIKPAEESNADAYKQYVRKLALLHNIMIYSMKCKQTTDLANTAKLRELLSEFRQAYFGESAEKSHDHTH